MSQYPATVANAVPADRTNRPADAVPQVAQWVLLLGAAGIPLSLVWDFSWESTVGIDRFWSPPHAATYLSVLLAGTAALRLVLKGSSTETHRAGGVRFGRLSAPLGAWLALWGAAAFLGAVLFDRWWQSAYGLGAGIWHPPQISKAVAFFAVLAGAWLLCLSQQNEVEGGNGSGAVAFAVSGGLVMALITVVTLVSNYPNRQHSAWFYEVACSTYPVVLVALAVAGRPRFPATAASLAYLGVLCAMVWLLPVFPAKPLIAPIYNRLDYLLAPPFPLLLLAPAAAVDWLLRHCAWPTHRWRAWLQAGGAGFTFAILFIGTQWIFAEFLLTDMADNWFFAGGGKHWPFFLKIAPNARQAFWGTFGADLDWSSALAALGLAVGASRIGLWLGAWMTRLRR